MAHYVPESVGDDSHHFYCHSSSKNKAQCPEYQLIILVQHIMDGGHAKYLALTKQDNIPNLKEEPRHPITMAST